MDTEERIKDLEGQVEVLTWKVERLTDERDQAREGETFRLNEAFDYHARMKTAERERDEARG